MEIVIEGPRFYDQEDENIFFNCIYALPEYKEVKGKGLNLHIQLKEPITDSTVIQLVIICRRWQIAIEPLKVLKKPSNADLSLWEKQIEFTANT